jgi:ESS family glutamate:Na+ symporter
VQVSLSELETIIIALIALFIGMAVRAALPWLRRIDLPDAVVGGLLMALLALVARLAFGWEFTFGSHLRDLLLLIFFSTIGLSAKLRLLAAGGRPLIILCILTALLIALQNLAGAGVAVAWGAHPFYVLLGGGLSFVGGPGTALAWAKEASAAGLGVAHSVGIGAATLAVIAGALLAGPAAGTLIRKSDLHPAGPATAPGAGAAAEPEAGFGVSGILVALLMIAVSVYLGEKINVWARGNGTPRSPPPGSSASASPRCRSPWPRWTRSPSAMGHRPRPFSSSPWPAPSSSTSPMPPWRSSSSCYPASGWGRRMRHVVRTSAHRLFGPDHSPNLSISALPSL